jgi:hypothetical protein
MIMKDDTNDTTSGEFQDKIPPSLDRHLRAIMQGDDLNQFREQLPAAFLKDASEGLQQLKDERQLENVLRHLNQGMRGQLSLKKRNRKRRNTGNMSWTYWAILIILLLTVAGFVLVRMALKH